MPALGGTVTAENKEAQRQRRLGTHASAETREKMRLAHLGHPVSSETREKQRVSNLRTWSSIQLRVTHQEISRARIARTGPPRSPWTHTKPENILVSFLRAAGFEVEREKQFGRFRVDAYLPQYHLAFEADGVFWHSLTESRRIGYYSQRDRFLFEQFSLPVVHLTDHEILTTLEAT